MQLDLLARVRIHILCGRLSITVRPMHCFLLILTCAVALGLFLMPAFAQTSPEIERLAMRTAEKVVKARPQQVLVATTQNCLFDTQLCQVLDTSIRAEINKMNPDVRILNAADLIGLLSRYGLLPIDIYSPSALRVVARAAGANILVTENAYWETNGHSLTTLVFHTAQDKYLGDFTALIPRAPGSNRDDEPLFFKDPSTGVALIFGKSQLRPLHMFRFPKCQNCPQPQSRDLAALSVILIVTITDQGIPEDIGVIEAPSDAISRQVANIVRQWRFYPALDANGKPFAVREQIFVPWARN
jgi:hypothetical protein